ncbi:MULTISPECIES: HmuY family protein [Leptospira]|uniref:HmuY family protein n=1 Tax=Leptospira sp. serovar Kenya TaxID=1242990 RepID=UPI0009B69D0D
MMYGSNTTLQTKLKLLFRTHPEVGTWVSKDSSFKQTEVLTYSEGQGGACLTNPVLTDFNVAASSTSRALGCTNAFFSPDTNVSEIAAGGIQTNYVGSNVLNKWFNYTFAFLQPNYNIFIVRSNTGNEYYLFQITGYYNSEGTSAHPTVRWKQIPY